MRQIIYVLLALVAVVTSCTKESKEEPYNPDGSPITQAQALEIVKEDVDYYDVVYVSKSIVKKGTTFMASLSDTPVPVLQFDSWIVMIDSDPLANGGKKWLYIYVNAYSGNADDDSWEYGLPRPGTIEFECIKNNLRTASSLEDPNARVSSQDAPGIATYSTVSSQMSNNWAVIISGGANPSSNYERYWNNCSAMYKCLREVYGYRRDRIIVIMSDGTSSGLDRRMNDGRQLSSPLDLDGDGTNDINYSATRSNLSNVFNYLRGQVKSDEQVLIFVTDHGARRNNESYICLWNGEEISAPTFIYGSRGLVSPII